MSTKKIKAAANGYSSAELIGAIHPQRVKTPTSASQREDEAEATVYEERRLSPYLLKLVPSVLAEVREVANDRGTTTMAVLRDFIMWGLYIHKALRRSPNARLMLVEDETPVRELVIS